MKNPSAIIVGAGPAGLACAASMRAQAIDVTVLEKANAVGSTWRRHYDRLHLHTDSSHSGLPGMEMPRSFPTYPSRTQVVSYLESYAAHFGIRPVFDTTVTGIRRYGLQWCVETTRVPVSAEVVVVATGWADFPYRPFWPGSEAFRGDCIHSCEYRNASPYLGKRVLVVGFGNSGGEIALDLAVARIDTTLAVRGPVQILPRDLLGIPILTWAIAQRSLPAKFVDYVNEPIIRLAIGPIERFGLRRAGKRPRRMVEEDRRVPLLDVGTLAKIRDGSIKVRRGVDRFTPDGVVFSDLSAEQFDSVILATGFRPDLRQLLSDANDVLDENGKPVETGKTTKEPGLYFCGLTASPTGQLREIGLEAKRIAKLAKHYLASVRT
ncbi:NAD(P)/FAD-dependent oxidoreductase [Bradyrhizobium sp. NP1]|uniref:flavin-containing monooxygenase n=1 Tax=Bradyrhizobium sp. NP1 TaxID=3049772 RepID=UPI0025A4DDDE|nr:NAD(P)/FAD-dependent oxidoreductase [Bradyrhizobium sp. NP1]WJR80944.1 NAD(P)/FAD-dependent oxidoreductase [Bradyrhizobium sp. NP1]